jgi:hypothetical protein
MSFKKWSFLFSPLKNPIYPLPVKAEVKFDEIRGYVGLPYSLIMGILCWSH